MGLLKFIKKIFSKEKNNENKVENNTVVDTNTLPYLEDKHTKKTNINQTNNQNNVSQLKENKERLPELEYLKQENKSQIIETENITINKLNTIWDIIKIKENTQAEHIIKSIPTDKWVTMDEIRHNIKLEFNIEYSNEKSLYPYLKTLTDINLIKLNNTGKKRTWKKNVILIKEK